MNICVETSALIYAHYRRKVFSLQMYFGECKQTLRRHATVRSLLIALHSKTRSLFIILLITLTELTASTLEKKYRAWHVHLLSVCRDVVICICIWIPDDEYGAGELTDLWSYLNLPKTQLQLYAKVQHNATGLWHSNGQTRQCWSNINKDSVSASTTLCLKGFQEHISAVSLLVNLHHRYEW